MTNEIQNLDNLHVYDLEYDSFGLGAIEASSLETNHAAFVILFSFQMPAII